MSRRKQAKPQHVEFGESATDTSASATLHDACGDETSPVSERNQMTDEGGHFQIDNQEANESSVQYRRIATSSEHQYDPSAGAASPVKGQDTRQQPDYIEQKQSDSMEVASLMPTKTGDEDSMSAAEKSSCGGAFVSQHRNLVFSIGQPQDQAQERSHCGSLIQSVASDQREEETDGTKDDLSELAAASPGHPKHQAKSPEMPSEVHSCGVCGETFRLLSEFLQHKPKKCSAGNTDKDSDCVVNGSDVPEADVINRGDEVADGTEISNDDVMTSHYHEVQDEMTTTQSREETHGPYNTVSASDLRTKRDPMPPSGGYENNDDTMKSHDDDRKANSNFEADEQTRAFDDGEMGVRDTRNESKASAYTQEQNEAEILRREISAAEAMSQAIQRMTAFATQAGGDDEKPEICAIKNQMRMIQQQQSYQVQMLNFLQWQLAFASSPRPQTTHDSGKIEEGYNRLPQQQFLFNHTTAPGAQLMPQMVAAMALNNMNKADGGMPDLTKAGLIMSMQQNAADNAQNIRSLFGRSLQAEESTMHEGAEQRYQLKTPVGNDEAGNPNSQDKRVAMEHTSKYDSEYDEDRKSTGFSNNHDDTSSSHGSQEDGELRDGVLSATSEEHRHRCRFCQKVFGSDSALQIHIRSHTGERPFKCNICGNRFTTKGNLKVHFMRHKSKYPHIPMNNHPVPEYLDNIPTSTGVPYGMSILPEKAVLERPRLHGNPSIHMDPQQAAALLEREAASRSLYQHPVAHFNSAKSNEGLASALKQPDHGFANSTHADLASAAQGQLFQRRESYGDAEWDRSRSATPPAQNDNESGESDPRISALQAAMMPYLPTLAARHQFEALPPQLRYLLPHHLQTLHNQAASNRRDVNNTAQRIEKEAGVRAGFPLSKHGTDRVFGNAVNLSSRNAMVSSSETSKLQRLVENIDSGHVLQKNECHICHRILSCQSALKLHYRTHTGERPYKCDLCSRAFTTRGNLRTHYSSVHRRQMRPIPPGGSHASRTNHSTPFQCHLCTARFREMTEYQQHMHMHAMFKLKCQQEMLGHEQETPMPDNSASKDTSSNADQRDNSPSPNLEDNVVESRNSSKDMAVSGEKKEVAESEPKAEDYDRQLSPEDSRSSKPNSPTPKSEEDINSSNAAEEITENRDAQGSDVLPPNCGISPTTSSPLEALSNLSASALMPQHNGSMLEHQLAALRRIRAGSLTVCEICEKPFSCQSALEIHLRTHTKERPFSCRICQRSFTTKGNLKQHLLTHNITDIPEEMLQPASSPRNAHSAPDSPRSSPTANDLGSHIVLKRPATDVTDEASSPKRTYPRHWCHICQKQFSSASSLQIHNRTHTGEKPFACSVCGRAFTTKGNLKVHMGTHVWGAGGSRRGRRISMDNPLISPWMKNIPRPRAPQNLMGLPTTGHVTDPAALYQQYAAIASGLLAAKQDATSRLILPMSNGHQANSASPGSSSGSPLPSSEVTSVTNPDTISGMQNSIPAETEWFLKAYQRTQGQVN